MLVLILRHLNSFQKNVDVTSALSFGAVVYVCHFFLHPPSGWVAAGRADLALGKGRALVRNKQGHYILKRAFSKIRRRECGLSESFSQFQNIRVRCPVRNGELRI